MVIHNKHIRRDNDKIKFIIHIFTNDRKEPYQIEKHESDDEIHHIIASQSRIESDKTKDSDGDKKKSRDNYLDGPVQFASSEHDDIFRTILFLIFLEFSSSDASIKVREDLHRYYLEAKRIRTSEKI